MDKILKRQVFGWLQLEFLLCAFAIQLIRDAFSGGFDGGGSVEKRKMRLCLDSVRSVPISLPLPALDSDQGAR